MYWHASNATALRSFKATRKVKIQRLESAGTLISTLWRLSYCALYLKIKLPESYAGGSVTTGRLSHAGQAKGDDHDEKRYPRPPSLGFGVRPTTPHPVKTIMSKPPKYASDGARWEDFVQKIYITGSRDRRFGQTNCRQRRMETPFQGDQGPEWAVAPYVEGWMNGRGGGQAGGFVRWVHA